RVLTRHEIDPELAHRPTKPLAVRAETAAQQRARFTFQDIEDLDRRRRNRWCQRVRKQIRARALPQQLDDLLASRSIAARRAAERPSQRPGYDVDAPLHAAKPGPAATAI